jgi:hypothetical protein
MARDDPQINVRMSAQLKAALEAAATESGRSLTAEIVGRLEQSMIGAKHPPNIIVRLEALQPGARIVDVPLGTFLETMAQSLRENIATVSSAPAEMTAKGRMLLALDDAMPVDTGAIEELTNELQERIRTRRMREAELLQRRRLDRERSDDSAEE